MSSDEDATQLMAAFRKGPITKTGANEFKSASAASPSRRSTPRRSPARPSLARKRASIAVESFLSDSSSEVNVAHAESPPKVRRVLHVRASPVRDRDEYTYYEPKDEVESIVQEITTKGQVMFEVKLAGGGTTQVSEGSPIQ